MNARTKAAPLALDGTVWLTVDGALLGGRHRVELLRAIDATGSITQAARALDISYKSAWDAVDAMNNLAGFALVERTTGGRGGGRTTLTERGLRLVDRYVRIETLHAEFVAHLSAQAGDLSGADIDLLRTINMKTSARNQFHGEVVALRTGAVNDEVDLRIGREHTIVAVVTHESVESLGLAVGAKAFALVKASSVLIATELASARLSARNQFEGTVTHHEKGAVNDEVVISLGGADSADGHLTVTAIVTSASAKALGLEAGVRATALFKASSVIVGVAG